MYRHAPMLQLPNCWHMIENVKETKTHTHKHHAGPKGEYKLVGNLSVHGQPDKAAKVKLLKTFDSRHSSRGVRFRYNM